MIDIADSKIKSHTFFSKKDPHDNYITYPYNWEKILKINFFKPKPIDIGD